MDEHQSLYIQNHILQHIIKNLLLSVKNHPIRKLGL